MKRHLARWLTHPALRGLPLDDPRTTERRAAIVHAKPFLRAIYDDWYGRMAAELPGGPGAVLELGSGAGFFSEHVPGLITSEVFPVRGVRAVLDATALPFSEGALRAIAMTDVLHHIAAPRAFMREAARCVRPAGRLVMIEPWVSPWSRWVYTRLHHEVFSTDAETWEFTSSGPLSGANGALPWIMFVRDRERFESELPEWRIVRVEPGWPFRYLVSGGVSMRSLMPGWTTPAWRLLERLAAPERWAMFALIVLERRPA